MRVRAYACAYILVLMSRVPGFAAWLHSGTSGGRDPMGRTSSGAKRDGGEGRGGGYNEGGFEAYTPCLGPAESRTKEKRVRSP